MSEPMVTCTFEIFDGFRTKIAQLEAELGAAKAKLEDAKMVAGGGDLSYVLRDALRRAMEIVHWAQGNRDPECYIGWPTEKLTALADFIKAMPGVTQIEIEWANDARKYAAEAAVIEAARKIGRQGELAKIPRSSMGTGQYAQKAAELLSGQAAQQDQGGHPAGDEQHQGVAPAETAGT